MQELLCELTLMLTTNVRLCAIGAFSFDKSLTQNLVLTQVDKILTLFPEDFSTASLTLP